MTTDPDFSLANPEADGPTAIRRSLEPWLRIACQVIGIGMVLIGSYFLIVRFADVTRLIHSPEDLRSTVDGVGNLIHADRLDIPAKDRPPVPVGRILAFGFSLVLYIVCVWIAGLIVVTGAKLALGVVNERRELLAAMRELLMQARPKPRIENDSK